MLTMVSLMGQLRKLHRGVRIANSVHGSVLFGVGFSLNETPLRHVKRCDVVPVAVCIIDTSFVSQHLHRMVRIITIIKPRRAGSMLESVDVFLV